MIFWTHELLEPSASKNWNRDSRLSPRKHSRVSFQAQASSVEPPEGCCNDLLPRRADVSRVGGQRASASPFTARRAADAPRIASTFIRLGRSRSAEWAGSNRSLPTRPSLSNAHPEGGERHRQGRLGAQRRRRRRSGLLAHRSSNLRRRGIRIPLREFLRSVSWDRQLCARHASAARRLDRLAGTRWYRAQREAPFLLQPSHYWVAGTELSRRLLARTRPSPFLSLHPRTYQREVAPSTLVLAEA
jgi:hypothetical protein